MNEFGKILVLAGVALVLAGLLLWLGAGKTWLGRLPGDIHYKSDRVTLYIPIATCLLLSLILTLLIWFFRR